MAAEAEAAREARAKVIAAEGEQRASRALKEAAEVIADSPAALQLRYLQTLNSIAAEKNSTIVFPVPMELFRGFVIHNNNNNNQPQNGCHSLNLLSPQSSTSSISDPVHDLPLSLLQQGWRKFWSKREQRPYFFNKITNESLWEMPPIPLDGTEITHYDPITDPLGIQSGDNQSNHFNRVCAPLRIGEKRPFLDDPYNGSCKKFILR